MNIDNLTIKEAREIASLFASVATSGHSSNPQSQCGLDSYAIGQKVIIRTYSAGVWFGTLSQKAGNEVILTDARRMWRWWAAEGISLSAVATHGINRDKSKIVDAVPSVWLEAIEIIPCTPEAIESIGGCKNAQAE